MTAGSKFEDDVVISGIGPSLAEVYDALGLAVSAAAASVRATSRTSWTSLPLIKVSVRCSVLDK